MEHGIQLSWYWCCAFMILVICSCTRPSSTESKMLATDYLYAQRAFPYGYVDLDAYQAAVANRLSQTSLTKGPFDNSWNALGPTNICGRITDLEIPADKDNTIYAGTASGGLFRSDDRGDSWRSLFDQQPTQAIGDLAISKNNPGRIYVGTGEANAGGSSIAYDGLGVFVSDDGGDIWNHRGLETVGSIGRVVIDPEDDDVAFVAAMGSLFGNNSERGIYRTQDAGASWEQVLFVSDSTGGIDLAIHPEDGDIIYAAMWERIRKVYNRQYGGATSGIFRSLDGGNTWQELTSGLPVVAEAKGRIGLAISESSPNIIYAFYANADGTLNGIYRTDNGGDNWIRIPADVATVTFNWWFGKIYVHPTNPDELYLTNLSMFRSQDGGRQWTQVFQDAHVDHHAMAIHPANADLVYNGNDGGVYLGKSPAYDSSFYKNGMNNIQFYTCEIDPNNSSILYGGTQDNGILKSTAQTEYWEQIIGGDGFHVEVDPTNSDKLYLELFFGTIRTSDDGGSNIDFAFEGLEGRFNFNAPLVIDPNDPAVLYTGSQTLFRTENQAVQWTAISPDLTNSDNPDGNIRYGTITAIDVSAQDSDVLYVGTDDGMLWRSRDGGANYQLVSENLPRRWVTSVHHDPHDPAGVYVTFSGFRFNESKAQLFYSDNFGATWQAIGTALPDIPVNDIQPDGIIDQALYVATDIGVYFSADRGVTWQILGDNLPTVSVQDLDIHNEDRILGAATFGKGMYTYDLPTVVSVEDQNLNAVSLYPNPTSGRVAIQSEIPIDKLRVYSIEGSLMLESTAVTNLDISHLPDGQYSLQLQLGNTVLTKQLLKQN